MGRRMLRWALLVCPAVVHAQAAPTPPIFTRAETGACEGCTLKLSFVASVGSADDIELLRDWDRMLALPGGGFVAWGPDGPLLRYDANGQYVGTLGREGDGPGEYRGIQSATTARGDSVALFSYGKLTIIDATTGRGRTSQSPKPTRAFRLRVLPNGDALVQHYNGAPGPFVVMAPDGAIRHAFGPETGTITLHDGRKIPDYDAQQYLIAPAPAGGFWAAPVFYRYGLQRWSTTGSVLQQIDRTPPWWPSYDYPALREYQLAGAGNAPPLPYLLGLWVGRGERLFVLTRTADANWKTDPNAPTPREPGREGPRIPWEPTGGLARYFDAVLEMYDGTSGEFLGSWRNDDLLGEPIGQEMLAIRSTSSDGVITYDIWRVVVEGR